MSSDAPSAPGDVVDPIEAMADEIAAESMVGLEGLLPPEDYAALEEIIAVSLAHQPELRRMIRKIVPDPVVAGSGDVPTRAAALLPGEEQRDTGTGKK